MDESIRRLRRAWCDEGVNPKYHRQQKTRLYEEWPSLYEAILSILFEARR